MSIWIVFAVLTALAALAVLVPLMRARRRAASAALRDVEVYKAQLGEVERDLERGLVTPEAAEAARTEIARRLLAANREAERGASGTVSVSGSGPLRAVQLVAIVGVPALALGAYLATGSPDLPDQPLQARLEAPATGRSLEELVARVEHQLSRNPSDGRGWAVLAPVYMRMGRAEDAAAAYASAIRLLGSSPERETDMGEALVIANKGIVSAEARAAFERAVKLDPEAVKPRFFLALALTQENRKDEAIDAWQALLAEAKGDEPWAEAVRGQLAGLGVETRVASAPPGPTREDVEAAAGLSDAGRAQMIRGMVDQLDTRLSEEGGSPEEWLRLMQALSVLGDTQRLDAAVKRARLALKDDPEGLARIDAAARDLGAGS